MASHSSTLAWRIPWTEEPELMGSRRAGHDWMTKSPSLLQERLGVSLCCLCAVPLGDSLLRTISPFVAVLWNLWKKPCWLPEPGNQGVSPGWQPQKPRCRVCAQAPFQEIVAGVQLLSRVQPFETPWTAGHQASLSFTISWSLLKLMSIESVMPSEPSHPLSPSSLAFSLYQRQNLFLWVSSSLQVARVLELQYQFFQWIFRTDFL